MRTVHPGASRRSRTRDVAGSGEAGFILIMTLMLLAVLLALVGTVSVSAVDAGKASTQVSLRVRAYAVADAGLQTALFRLNQTGGTTGATGTMGNGETYSYSVSTLSSQGGACAGLWVQSSGQAVQQDCITSTGTAGSYSVKVQDRVVGYTPIPSLFPVNGLFAVNGFTAGQNLTDNGTIASNGQITWGGGAVSVTGSVQHVAGYPISGTCTGTCTPVLLMNALTVPSSSATTPSAYAAARASNSDSTGINWGGLSSFWTSSSFEFDSAASGGGGTVTFDPGTYYFCDVNVPNQNAMTLQAASSATAANPVIIYVDSPSDGSVCSSGTGNFTAGKNTMTVAGVSGAPGSMQIFIYGTPGCTTTCSDILSKNSGSYTDVQIFAPNSALASTNNITLTGDFVIGSVTSGNNSTLTYSAASSGSGGSGGLSTYYPSAHQICTTGSTC